MCIFLVLILRKESSVLQKKITYYTFCIWDSKCELAGQNETVTGSLILGENLSILLYKSLT